MSDSTNTNSKPANKPKTPRGSATKLAERAEKLKAELEATQAALRQKQAAKAAREQAQAKKDRTHNLIVGGLIYLHYIQTMLEIAEKSNPPKVDELKNSVLTQIDRYFKSLPANTEAQKKRIERDIAMFAAFLKSNFGEIFK